MAENDEVNGSDFADTPYVPTGFRRSTFTPPSGKYPPLFDPPQATAGSEQADSDGNGSQDSVDHAANAAPASIDLPDRPTRRSLQDDELVRTVTLDIQKPDSTLDAIDRLQAQLQLREEEAQQFTAWEQRMRTIGTPEALESIAEAIPEFTGVIPIIPLGTAAAQVQQSPQPHDKTDPAASPANPQPDADRQTIPAAGQGAAEPEPFLHPEQFPPPKLEERVEVGGLQEPNLSNHLVFLPPWMSVSRPEPVDDEYSVEAPAEPETGMPADEVAISSATLEADSEASADSDAISDADVVSDAVPDAWPVEEVNADNLIETTPESVTPESPVLYELVDPAVQHPVSLTAAQPDPSAAAPTEADAGVSPECDLVPPVDLPTSIDEEEQAPETLEVAADVPVQQEPLTSGQPEPGTSSSPFDALLAGDFLQAVNVPEAAPFSLLYPLLDGEPALTGSHEIIIDGLDSEPDDDDVDETDRADSDTRSELVGAFPVTSEGIVLAPVVDGSDPLQPVASPRISEGEQVIDHGEPATVRLFSIELSSDEATPVEHRVGRAARMFWLWFATNSSLVSVAFGAALFGLGMSLRQAILAVFIGVAISFLPLGLGTLAGKWSGQPTIVVSRATFGLVGNIVPAILTLITRLFWGAVLLWLVAVCTARILTGATFGGPFSETQLAYAALIVGFALAFIVALFGYALFARIQLILSAVSGALIIGLFILTWHEVDFRTALTVADGPWILVVTGVVLVFSFIGLVWANSSGDLARYQRPSGSGASASLWASFGATLPAFLLIAYGALLAASNPGMVKGLLTAPLDTIALMIPGWYTVPLLVSTVLGLLSGVALSIYSGGLALRAVGVRLSQPWGVAVMGAMLVAIAVLMILSGTGVSDVFRDLATTLAVPIAAWAGIFAAEVMIRRRRFDEESLLRPGGVYPSVNWVNLVMLVVASVVGFAFTSATVSWLSWQGYGFALFGFPAHGEVAASDLGVLVALVIGLLTPLAAGISTVRQQESATK